MASDTFILQHLGAEEGPYTVAELQAMARAGRIKPNALARREGGAWFSVGDVPGVYSKREWLVALLLSIFLGGFGIDRFYLGHTGLGVLKLVTLGGCGLWSLVDMILIALDQVRDDQDLPLKR